MTGQANLEICEIEKSGAGRGGLLDSAPFTEISADSGKCYQWEGIFFWNIIHKIDFGGKSWGIPMIL